MHMRHSAIYREADGDARTAMYTHWRYSSEANNDDETAETTTFCLTVCLHERIIRMNNDGVT
jgi:hypothetical protein